MPTVVDPSAVIAAFEKAGTPGLNASDVAVLFLDDPAGKITSQARAHAGRMIRQLVDQDVLAPHGSGRWRLAALSPPRKNGSVQPLVDRLPEPVIGVDVSEEEYKRIRASRGRKKPEQVRIAPELLSVMTPDELRRWRLYEAHHNEDDWRRWVPAMFPAFASKPMGKHHEVFWDHVWTIQAKKPSDPHVDIWNRGAGKSVSAEMAVVALAARERRRYCVYVSGTQTLADEHVSSIGTMLSSEMIALAYPDIADRAVSKYGTSKGWRRNRLHTASGFVVDALGLDVAARGIRIDEQRPDLIILDDIDDENDTPATVDKKIRAITRKILPAGSQDVCVIAVQNKVHANSIFARFMSTGGPNEPEPADFLSKRTVVGPIPAVWDLEYEQQPGENGRTRWVITGGKASWDGMPLESCQHELDTYGIEGFLAEFQHEEPSLSGGIFSDLDFTNSGTIRVAAEQVPLLTHTCVWVDPAVTKTDKSDSCGVVVDALGVDRNYYRLWAWERVASPMEALSVAINAAFEYGAEVVGVETDQGGDTWEVVYRQALSEIVRQIKEDNDGDLPAGMRIPRYEYAKAGSTQMSKTERAQRMRAEYLMGRIKHVGANVSVLERGLRRFPIHKPYDVVDAAFWSWRWLAGVGGDPKWNKRVRARAARGVLAPVGPGNLPR